MGVGSLGLVFPDILASDCFTSFGSVEVSNGGVLPHSTRVKEVANGSSRVLATNNHLVGISHHPDGWMMAEELQCTKCECIGKLQPAEVVSIMGVVGQKNILVGYTLQPCKCPTPLNNSSTCDQEK